MWVDVAATPGELASDQLGDAAVVVVDAIRASTSLLAGLEAGARRAIAVASIEEALGVRGTVDPEIAVLCGERGGRRIDGFDLGNSPLEFGPEAVADKVIVCTTTNGTRALERCRGARELMLGSFRNRKATADRLARLCHGAGSEACQRAVIVCAGKEGRLSLDDFLCAGLVVEALCSARPGVRMSDGARAALAAARVAGPPSAELLASTAAGEALVEIGLGADLMYCAELDVSRKVPVFGSGGFTLIDIDDG